MGNSPSSGLGSGSAHALRDVRTANSETEVERPRASTEPNENPQDFTNQFPVPPKPYITIPQTCLLRGLYYLLTEAGHNRLDRSNIGVVLGTSLQLQVSCITDKNHLAVYPASCLDVMQQWFSSLIGLNVLPLQ